MKFHGVKFQYLQIYLTSVVYTLACLYIHKIYISKSNCKISRINTLYCQLMGMTLPPHTLNVMVTLQV